MSSSRISHSPTSASPMKNIGLLVLKFIHLVGVVNLFINLNKASRLKDGACLSVAPVIQFVENDTVPPTCEGLHLMRKAPVHLENLPVIIHSL